VEAKLSVRPEWMTVDDFMAPGTFTVDGQDFGIYDLYAKNGWDAIDQFKEAVREQGILLQGHRFRIVDKKDTKL